MKKILTVKFTLYDGWRTGSQGKIVIGGITCRGSKISIGCDVFIGVSRVTIVPPTSTPDKIA